MKLLRLRGWWIEFCYSGTILTKQISTLLEKWIVDVEKIVRYIKRERETTQHRVVVLDIYIRKWRRRVLDKEKQRLSGGV